MRRLIVILFVAIMAASCRGGLSHDFLESPDIRLEVNGIPCLVYGESDCQLGYNTQTCTFTVMKDNASDYYSLTLEKLPVSEGEYINGDISWTTPESIETRKDIVFKVVKLEDDTIWLWNADGQIAVCVKILV